MKKRLNIYLTKPQPEQIENSSKNNFFINNEKIIEKIKSKRKLFNEMFLHLNEYEATFSMFATSNKKINSSARHKNYYEFNGDIIPLEKVVRTLKDSYAMNSVVLSQDFAPKVLNELEKHYHLRVFYLNDD